VAENRYLLQPNFDDPYQQQQQSSIIYMREAVDGRTNMFKDSARVATADNRRLEKVALKLRISTLKASTFHPIVLLFIRFICNTN